MTVPDVSNSKTDALIVVALYVTMSAVAFIAFAVDKRRARRGAWRISEPTLQGIALAGGWPGAWAGVLALRHKSSKATFKSVLVFITVLHVLIWCCVLAGFFN